MIALPEDITRKDILQWLEGGWFFVANQSGTYQIASMYGVSDKNVDDLITVLPMGGTEPITATRAQVFPHWPECGALNLMGGKFAVSLVRLQKKQWKRTYNGLCIKMRVISDAQEHFSVNADSDEVVTAAFGPQYFTYSDVVKFRFKDGWKSCAISPSLIVMKGAENDNTTVFLSGEIIGLIDDQSRFTCINVGLKRRLLPHFDYMVE
jgi:hypothetical protein